MAKQLKVFNPFYLLLMIVGVVFAFTAFGYGVMAVKMVEPHKLTAQDRTFVAFFDEHGTKLFLAEIVVLALFTLLAMVTDGFWTRRAELRQRRNHAGDPLQSTDTNPPSE